MAVQFGKTWWGEHWLKSLLNVDYHNRLPRGASYARNGYVKDVKFKGNQITARVSGSRATPYKVNLIVPPFFDEQKEKLMDSIIKNPALISKLLNRELDPSILTIANNHSLKVFPTQWTDFKMQCSCPDWAVPCKHLAAVIYMVSREIDNNPFLVFEIHDVNLLDELKKRGISIADQKKEEIFTLSTILKTAKPKKQDSENELVYDRVDFSTLHDISNSLLQLLPDAPPFYPLANFKDKYSARFLRAVRDGKKLINKKLDVDAIFLSDQQFAINHRSTFVLTIDGDNRISVGGDNFGVNDLSLLISKIFKLNPDHLPDYQPSVVAFHKVLFASLHLIANGCMVPQIVKTNSKNFVVRWLPALIDAEVRLLTEKLTTVLPSGILLSPVAKGKSDELLPVVNQTVELLSIFITAIIGKLSTHPMDLFEEIFFNNKPYAFDGVGESALSGGIRVWLHRFHLAAENFKPVLTITENGEHSFDLSVDIEDSLNPGELPVALHTVLTHGSFDQSRFKILQGLSLLSPFIAGLDNYINNDGKGAITFSMEEFSPFLIDILPAVRLLDIKVMLPKSLQTLLRPKPSVKIKRSDDKKGYVRLDDLLAFDWQVAIGDTIITPAEFSRLMAKASGLFRFKERYIYVSEAEMEKLSKLFDSKKSLTSFQLLQTALAEDYDGAPVTLTDDVRDLIRELTSGDDIELPSGLNAHLRPYQQRGFSWMYRNSRNGFGSIIADDMGLGKTLQVITLILKLKEEGAINKKQRALVVVPTGLLTNWQAEIGRFAPDVTSFIFHGAGRNLSSFDADVLLTTYGVLRSDAELLKKHKWQIMVIDEAQNIKNDDTNQSKAIKSIPANIRIAMSGTPVENRLTEFWSIMDFVNKGYLGNVKTFKSDFSEPIQVYNDEVAVNKFRRVTSPFMMRRMKTDKTIISDLPDKIEQNQYANLTRQQAALYEQTMNAAMAEIEGFSGSDSESLFKRQGLVLQMILALKQICNHPTNFLKNGNFDALLSGKVELLFELLDSITESGEKVLIFTQFKEMGDLLAKFIEERFGERPMFYHGGCSVEQRNDMVNRFQHNRADKIFVLSLKAAGTGLNLTAASHVIHFDLWWNPAVESQATDRAYRIGQNKNVMVHRLIVKNTFEERIDDMIQKKKHLADMTVATGENWIGKLSNKELREIFG